MLTNKQMENEITNHQGRENGFEFRGRHSSEFCLYVEKYPEQVIPKRKKTTASIPGRSGDLHYEDDAYENVLIPYECYFHAETPMPEALGDITGWLQQPGYGRLTDKYSPNYFRLGTLAGQTNVENHLNKYGRCKLVFDCKPQRFLISGETPIEFTSPSFIINPTQFNALPVIEVYGTGPGTVTAGNLTVEIKELEDVITLDCETQNAYRQVGEGAPENKNNCIYALEFPELLPGENTVSWTGDITSVKITPRWWTL